MRFVFLAYTFSLISWSECQDSSLTELAAKEGQETIKGSYQINAICVLANALRFDPTKYLSKYGAGSLSGSCADGSQPVGPLFMTVGLCKAAQFQADGMAKHNQMSHDTLGDLSQFEGKSDYATRIGRFFSKSKAVGENVGTGYPDPIDLNNAWIKSKIHCDNLMNAGYNAIGAGSANGEKCYADQTFAKLDETPKNRIMCGSHIVSKGEIFFLCAVTRSSSPVNLIFNGEKAAMSLDLGTQDSGIYRAQIDVPSDKCYSYAFEMNGEIFPRSGLLLTEGWGSCYDPGSGHNQQLFVEQ
jgi:hypothetical protein